jgi:hypothetical protein
MREADYRRRVVKLLAPLAAFPVENTTSDGAPDIATTLGWIEMKVATMPARSGSRVVIPLRNSQRIWLRGWARHGGRAWTLTVFSDEETWLMHDGAWASENLGEVVYDVLLQHAIGTWTGGPTSEELINVMRGEQT